MKAARFQGVLVVAALVALAGCSGGGIAPDNGANAAAGNEAAIAPSDSLNSAAQAGNAGAAVPVQGAAKIQAVTDALAFSYSWPAEAAAIPALDQWLRGNAATIRVGVDKSAVSDQQMAKKDGYPHRQHSYDESFGVVANTPVALVLQSEGYVYTGGAHGMPIATDIIWDKAKGRRVATKDLVDLGAFARAAKDSYCKELDRQRAEKRGNEPFETSIDEFTQCVSMTEQDILPISKGGSTLDTMRILILPYNAGPYAEGIYTIELPMTKALLATVRPAWKTAFSER